MLRAYKNLLLLLLLGSYRSGYAQYQTPGTGRPWDLPQLPAGPAPVVLQLYDATARVVVAWTVRPENGRFSWAAAAPGLYSSG
ncbi:hypothetical protein [Hymenobacter algoricola]|uniref:Uncharacterized protein n=1 Tax=Hymenobacter algoricola TaxID=486267 RepID=A0ABP7N498_9BACT